MGTTGEMFRVRFGAPHVQDVGGETLWASPVARTAGGPWLARLENIPFHVPRASIGDVVEIQMDDGMPHVVRVHEHRGMQTLLLALEEGVPVERMGEICEAIHARYGTPYERAGTIAAIATAGAYADDVVRALDAMDGVAGVYAPG